MLANRLSVLLAERQLTIKKVVNDLGISRSSISNIVNNPQANIATDTIDKICNYLEVTPNDFFAYSPYNISVKKHLEIRDHSATDIQATITHNRKNYVYSKFDHFPLRKHRYHILHGLIEMEYSDYLLN